MKQDKKFNEKWFADWKKIKQIEPHYDRVCNADGEEEGEPVIDRIDIVFTDDSRIRIVPREMNDSIFEGQEIQPFPFLEILVQEFKEVKPKGEVAEMAKWEPPEEKPKGAG